MKKNPVEILVLKKKEFLRFKKLLDVHDWVEIPENKQWIYRKTNRNYPIQKQREK